MVEDIKNQNLEIVIEYWNQVIELALRINNLPMIQFSLAQI